MTRYELRRLEIHLQAALRFYREHAPTFRSAQEMGLHYIALDDCLLMLNMVKTKKGSDEK